MSGCNCTERTIDGLDIDTLPAWELALRNAAHGHYIAPAVALRDAVAHIDALRRERSQVSP